MTQPNITSTERIRDLGDISASIPELLSSASSALTALTGHAASSSGPSSPMSSSDHTAPSPSLQTSKEAFTEHAENYFTTLQAIMARLRRQAYALEEADIIAAEAPVLQQQGAQTGRMNTTQGVGVRRDVPTATKAEEGDRITNGGLGGLDVAWLNSRVGNGGLEKEGETLAEATRLLKHALGEDEEMQDGA